MPLYRVLRSLSRKDQVIPRDSIGSLTWLSEESATKLLAVGSIARVSSPPLTELPDWDGRTRRLAVRGIFDAEQFLLADDGDLAEWTGHSVDTVRLWKEEVIRWLQPDEMKRGCCRG
jgi:hypothetical protein